MQRSNPMANEREDQRNPEPNHPPHPPNTPPMLIAGPKRVALAMANPGRGGTKDNERIEIRHVQDILD
jgi:hypothetical protein